MPSPSLMFTELHEQPQVLRQLLDDAAQPSLLGAELERARKMLASARHIVLMGCGSSYHAACAAAGALERRTKVPVRVVVSSEVVTDPTCFTTATHVIAVSQSGHTADTLQAMELARKCALPIVSVLADGHAPIAHAADVALVTRAGTERAIPSTKGFACQLATLWLLAQHPSVETLPEAVADVLACSDPVANVARSIAQAQSHAFLGTGTGFAIAQEGALKMKESARVPAQGYPTFEVRHGPLAALGADTPALLWHAEPARDVDVVALVRHLRTCEVPVTVFTPGAPSTDAALAAGTTLALPCTDPALAPMVGAVAFQLLAYHTARLLNRDMDAPPHLVKSVV